MRNFLKIAEGLHVMPLLLALQRNPQLWNQYTLRTTHPGTPHAEVEDIWLRFNDVREYERTGDPASIIDGHESVWYEAIHALPQARQHIFGIMGLVEGERLGRVLITKLGPGKRITPHVDGGDHAAYYERFHLMLYCPPEALFRAGDELVYMAPGDLWWFQNAAEHEVWNDSQTEDRITMIVDIKCSTVGK
jgi:Aspartyl/Asparaginyl beta-hydroxylase